MNYPMRKTEGYVRFRIESPSKFKKGSFRTVDIGQTGGHKLIRGKLKTTGAWKTQAVIVEKKTYPYSKPETYRIISRIKKYQ